MKKVFLLKNRYMDSLSLLTVAVDLTELPGVRAAECGMGTKQNMDLLREEKYVLPEDTTRDDIMLAVDADSEDILEKAFEAAKAAMAAGKTRSKKTYRDVNELEKDKFNVVQISLPGEYALKEAYKAVDRGMDVFMFTADIELDEERKLKEYARDHGRLMMGPDAGVGLLGGVAMAAGSIVRFGPIGVIGASGSGSQEVACLIEQMGSGVTCILGTGGRDLKKPVGGVSMKADLKRLEADADTKLICLVSMLADREVMEEVLCEADKSQKPVVAVFLGADEKLYSGHKVTGTYTLLEAAKACVRLVTGKEPEIGRSDKEMRELAKEKVAALAPGRRYFRGLYTGGTFAEEALMIFRKAAPDVRMHTNRDNTKYAERLKTHRKSEGHTLLDMGDLDFTAEAPHTVFDPTQRVERVRQELADPEVGLIAMDIILGPGVAKDPASCYVPIVREHPETVFVFAVCGGEGDPQGKDRIKKMLAEAGAIVTESNCESAYLNAEICREMEARIAK